LIIVCVFDRLACPAGSGRVACTQTMINCKPPELSRR